MMKSWNEIRKTATAFSKRWKDAYDAKSRRVRKVTPEWTFIFFYDGWNLVEERIRRTNGTTSTIRYHWGKDISGTRDGAAGVGGLLYLTVSNSSTPNSSTPNSSTPSLISMSYDRMGRRVTKNDHRFTSDSWWNNISDFVSRLQRERQHYQNEPCTKCNSAAVTCFLRCYAGEDNEGERWFCPNGDHAGEFYDDWSEIPESCFQSGIKPYWPPDEDIPEPPHVPYYRPSVSEVVNGINNHMY